LNKISSINVYPSIPRYFCYINDGKLIIKLFSIFYDFDGTGNFTKNNFLENFETIAKDSKALVTKILTGGYVNMNEISLNKTLDFVKHINILHITNTDEYELNDFSTIEDVKLYLMSNSNENFLDIFDNPNLIRDYISADKKLLMCVRKLKNLIGNLLLIESLFGYNDLNDLNSIYEIRKSFTYFLDMVSCELSEYIYWADNIPILTNCIMASSFFSDMIGYKILADDEKRNFIINILLKEFYSTHSILIFQIIMNMYNVINDYKHFNNDLIKINSDGTFSNLPDYDVRFPFLK
jgi:hypothetical protein